MAVAVFWKGLSRTGVGTQTAWPDGSVRGLAVLVAVGALVSGFLATGHADASRAAWNDGPALARLLRGMALLKMLMAAAASAGVLWRLGSAAGPLWLAGYAAAMAAMWAGPGLIWDLSHVRAGALLLHGGLFATLALLWRDPVAGARLGAVIARRRRELQERADPVPPR